MKQNQKYFFSHSLFLSLPLRILLKIHSNEDFVYFLSLGRQNFSKPSLREGGAQVFKVTPKKIYSLLRVCKTLKI